MSSPGRSEIRRILIVRPSALGDVCRTVPVLASLKRAFPEAEIDWVVQDSFVDAVRAHPDLHEVIGFPRARFSRVGRSVGVTREWFQWAAALRRRRYDVVYDCQGLARSGLITWLTRAARRIGFADAREGGSLGYTQRIRVDPETHTVDRMLGLIAADGVTPVHDLRLYVPADAQEWWRARSLRVGGAEGERARGGECERVDRPPAPDPRPPAPDPRPPASDPRPPTPDPRPPVPDPRPPSHATRPYAVLAPTSRWPAKRWPADRFAALVDPILERDFERVIMVGSGSERDQCGPLLERVAKDERLVDLLGATSVGALMAIIAQADLVIANDSAALHMAVGFDRPYLALYGPTDARLVGPYGGERWVVGPDGGGRRMGDRGWGGQRPAHKDPQRGAAVMERIGVEQVLACLDDLLREWRPSSAPGGADGSS